MPLAAGVVACLALGARHAAAQNENVVGASGVWLSGGMLLGGALFDGNAARTWANVGDPGPSVGGAFAAGYDARRVGAALDLEAASMRLGDRRGSSFALAATLRWRLPQPPATRWDSRIEVGYVRLGFGGIRVDAAEVPSDLFRGGSTVSGRISNAMTLLGNGIRLGVSMEHALKPGTNLVLGLGADAVYFDTATYQATDLSLARPGWGVMPRLLLGVRTFPRALRR
ncbi:MAG TPA: hypothetical protein VF461_23180 [Gemmatimonadaceae bacterium]